MSFLRDLEAEQARASMPVVVTNPDTPRWPPNQLLPLDMVQFQTLRPGKLLCIPITGHNTWGMTSCGLVLLPAML